MAKNLLAMQEMWEMQVPSLGQEDPLEKGMATHSRILAGKISWTEEPSRLQSIGSQTWNTTEQFHFNAICAKWIPENIANA